MTLESRTTNLETQQATNTAGIASAVTSITNLNTKISGYDASSLEKVLHSRGVIAGCKVTQGSSGTDMLLSIVTDAGNANNDARYDSNNVYFADGWSPFSPSFMQNQVDQITIATSDPTNGRIDVVYVGKYNNIGVETGTPSGSPTAPSISTTLVKLAEITVDAAATGIADAKITDAREWTAFRFTQLRSGDGTVAAPAWSFSSDTNMGLYRPAADSLGFVLNGIEQGRWNTTGLGIGTVSPGAALDISKSNLTIIVGADESATTRTDATAKLARVGLYHHTNAEEVIGIYLANANTSSTAELSVGGGTGNMNSFTTLLFYTAANTTTLGGTEIMRINTTGVGIFEPTPSKALDVKNGAAGGDILCYDIYTHDGFIHTSDERAKRLMVPSTLGLDFIKKLKPVSYKWKNVPAVVKDGKELYGAEIYTRTHYGLTAQDTMVALTDIGLASKDFAGYVYEEDRDKFGVRYTEFIAPIIKAIQEVDEKVDMNVQALISRIEVLEAA